MLVESQGDPDKDPLLIWFNGGPGCSSLLGFFQENGPWIIDDVNHEVKKNDYSWNKRANVLYLESPAGVGFSVADGPADTYHNDISQSDDAWAALQKFYELFTEYKDRDLFISGESYGGIYVPYLSWQIYRYNTDQAVVNGTQVPLKGFLVGNGVTNWKYDADRSWTDTLYGFDMIPTHIYDSIMENKCDFNYKNEDKHTNTNSTCDVLFNKTMDLTKKLNHYDLYRRNYEDPQLLKKLGCESALDCPALKEENEGYLTMSKYAAFSRKSKNDHRRIHMGSDKPEPEKKVNTDPKVTL